MKERKNIDRLFQEKFKDFEAIPPENLWASIAEKITEKEDKRRVIPFWWKLSGVAAVFLLGWMGISYYNSNQGTIPNTETNIVDSEKTESNFKTNESIVNQNNPTSNEINNSEENIIVKSGKSTSISNTNESVVNQDNTVVNSKNNSENSTPVNKFDKSEILLKDSENQVVITNKSEKSNAKNYTNSVSDQHSLKNKKSDKEIQELFTNKNQDFKKLEINESKTFTDNINQQPLKRKFDDKDIKIVTQISDSIGTALAEKTVEPNALEELLKEKEEKPKVELKTSKWQITTMVAPVYLSSTSNGSPIDEEFANNPKDFSNSLSYGLGINYAVSKKINVRTGVNRLNMSYNTNDIMFYPELSGRSMRNINSNVSASTVIVVRDNLIDPKPSTATQGREEGYMQQNMGYIEVPFEVSYKVFDKKISLNVIGGMSSLFLNENNLTVVSDNISAELGKASNLSNYHFSTNIGFGINYDIWKSFQIQVEPILKYQFNTFTNNVGGFRPYVFGVYSGLSYKF